MTTDTPIARLAEFGIDLTEIVANLDRALSGCIRSGSRVLVSAVGPFEEHLQDRLNVDANFEDFDELQNLPQDHPLLVAARLARGALLNSMLVAHVANPNGLDDVSRCLRLTVAVAAGPNFKRSGYIGSVAQLFAKRIFNQTEAPSLLTLGVSALPRGMLLNVEAEYELHG